MPVHTTPHTCGSSTTVYYAFCWFCPTGYRRYLTYLQFLPAYHTRSAVTARVYGCCVLLTRTVTCRFYGSTLRFTVAHGLHCLTYTTAADYLPYTTGYTRLFAWLVARLLVCRVCTPRCVQDCLYAVLPRLPHGWLPHGTTYLPTLTVLVYNATGYCRFFTHACRSTCYFTLDYIPVILRLHTHTHVRLPPLRSAVLRGLHVTHCVAHGCTRTRLPHRGCCLRLVTHTLRLLRGLRTRGCYTVGCGSYTRFTHWLHTHGCGCYTYAWLVCGLLVLTARLVYAFTRYARPYGYAFGSHAGCTTLRRAVVACTFFGYTPHARDTAHTFTLPLRSRVDLLLRFPFARLYTLLRSPAVRLSRLHTRALRAYCLPHTPRLRITVVLPVIDSAQFTHGLRGLVVTFYIAGLQFAFVCI